jgi:hypothetical protein
VKVRRAVTQKRSEPVRRDRFIEKGILDSPPTQTGVRLRWDDIEQPIDCVQGDCLARSDSVTEQICSPQVGLLFFSKSKDIPEREDGAILRRQDFWRIKESTHLI